MQSLQRIMGPTSPDSMHTCMYVCVCVCVCACVCASSYNESLVSEVSTKAAEQNAHSTWCSPRVRHYLPVKQIHYRHT
jgi:hypothetical protein